MLSLYQMVWIFAIYAFLGWCTEVVYATVCTGKFINRGFLNGPFCPIYGFGVLIVVISLTPLKENLAFLFAGSVLLTSVLEFITGFMLEKFFNEKWWDYSDEPFNIKGYVCLKFSLMWGIACVLVMNTVQPLIMRFILRLPEIAGNTILAGILLIIIVDAVITVTAILHMKQRMKMMNELGDRLKAVSNKLGEQLSDGTLRVKEKLEAGKSEFEEMRVKYKSLTEQNGFVQNRLLKSFPRLHSSYKGSIERLKQHLNNLLK